MSLVNYSSRQAYLRQYRHNHAAAISGCFSPPCFCFWCDDLGPVCCRPFRLRQSSSASLTGYGAALPGSTTPSPHHARAGSGVVDVSGTSDGEESGSSLEGDGDGKGPPTPVFEKSALQPWHPLGAPTARSSSVLGTPSPRRRGGDDLVLSDDGDTFSDDDDEDEEDEDDEEEDFHQARQGSVPATAEAVVQSSSGGAATAEETEKRRKRAVALKEIIGVGSRSPVRRLASKGTVGTNFGSHFQGGWSDTGLSGGPEASSSSSTPAGAGAVRAKTFGLKREIRGTKLENVFKEMKDETDGGEGGSGKSPVPTLPASAPPAENPPAVSLRLQAPLVLHNLLCAPMLYRVVNRQGLLSAEGVLPVGASVALHRVDLCQKQYASFLLVNYPWSDFIKVHSPTSAHPLREKVRTVEVRGVKVSVPGEESSSSAASSSSSSSSKKGRELPGLHLHVALQARRCCRYHCRCIAIVVVVAVVTFLEVKWRLLLCGGGRTMGSLCGFLVPPSNPEVSIACISLGVREVPVCVQAPVDVFSASEEAVCVRSLQRSRKHLRC